MEKCFVIQPFDKGRYDKRYHEIFGPAIEAADLEAYRVDMDPSVSIPMEQIESGIREARICFAEISTDNPNVWFELGYAIAAKKEVVMVCSDERKNSFPFDVHHRQIISYKTESPGDFIKLKAEVTNRLKALLEKEERIDRAAVKSTVASFSGLEQHEMVTLVTIAENIKGPGDRVDVSIIKSDMQRAGFNRIASVLGLTQLLEKKFIADDAEGPDEEQRLYYITESGMKWLIENQRLFDLRRSGDDDDIPF